MNFDPQAAELNRIIAESNPVWLEFLSRRGKAIYFPHRGIIAQSAEAKGTNIDASIGIAINDNGQPMRLASIDKNISLDPKQVYPYAFSFGNQDLRQVWYELMKQKNPALQTTTNLPVVTAALTHALYVAGYLFVDELDAIILPDKYWENYGLIFEHGFGAMLNLFNTFANGGFDLESFRIALSRGNGKKIILFNFPNNPTGYTITNAEAREIISTLTARAEAGDKLVVLCDDAYFGLVYESGIYQQSLFAELANAHQNIIAVKIDGATKEEYAWGFRVGFITIGYRGMTDAGAKAWESKLGGIVRGSISSAPNLSQNLILQALCDPGYAEDKQAKYETLKQRYEIVKQSLQNPKFAEYFTPLPYNSGYFMCIELKPGLDADAIRKKLIKDFSIGTIAIGNLLRIAYSGIAVKDIPTVFESLYKICKK